MHFATILVVASTIVSSALAASVHSRQQFDDEVTTLTRRDSGFMMCTTNIDYLLCKATHECLASSGAPSLKAGTSTGSRSCTTQCSCEPPKAKLLKCPSRNDVLTCQLTHHCPADRDKPLHITGTSTENGWCGTQCSCIDPSHTKAPPPVVQKNVGMRPGAGSGGSNPRRKSKSRSKSKLRRSDFA